nr:hypothetical protein [Methanobrevibacter arboriphilus]
MNNINLIEYISIESNTHSRVNLTLVGLADALLKLDKFNAFKNSFNVYIKNNYSFFDLSILIFKIGLLYFFKSQIRNSPDFLSLIFVINEERVVKIAL